MRQKSKYASSDDPTSLQKKKITSIKAPDQLTPEEGQSSHGVIKNSNDDYGGVGFSQDTLGCSPSKHSERERGSSVKKCPFDVDCKVISCKYIHSDRDVRLSTSNYSNSKRSKSREVGEKVTIQEHSRKDNIVEKISKSNKSNTDKCIQKKEKFSRMLFEEGCLQDSFGETRVVKYRRKGSKEDDIKNLKAYNKMIRNKVDERRDRNRKKEEILKDRGGRKKEDLRKKYPATEPKPPGCHGGSRGLDIFCGMRIGEPSQTSRASSQFSPVEMERNYAYGSNEGFRDVDLRQLGREDMERLEHRDPDIFLDQERLSEFLGPSRPDSRDRGHSGLGLDCFQPLTSDTAFSDPHMSSSGTGWAPSPVQEFYPGEMGGRRVVEKDWSGEGGAYFSPRDDEGGANFSPRDRQDLRDSYPLADQPFLGPGDRLFDEGRGLEREGHLFGDGRGMENEERSRDFTTGLHYGF